MMTSMNFLTLSYNCVTISFLPEIWFWGPTHPTFLYDVTLFSLFFIEGFPYKPHFWGGHASKTFSSGPRLWRYSVLTSKSLTSKPLADQNVFEV